jgi:D-amino-acid oxidase
VVSALRPFREGGLRLDKEILYGKIVYHNYGHGHWGLNLAYCTALI